LLTTPTVEEATVGNAISEKQWVGIDLHLHRSVIVRIDEHGKELEWVRIDNDPKGLVREVRKAGRGAPVAIEATYGWYWAVDALRKAKFDVHLAHPYGMRQLRKRKKVKTDRKDAYELANLLRLESLPEAWIAPPDLRELRELVRHRQKLVKVATSVKSGIRAGLAKHGIRLTVSQLESPLGQTLLDGVDLPGIYADRLESQRRMLLLICNEIDLVEADLAKRLKTNTDYRNLLKIKGIGPTLAAIFVLEIGDVHRFRSAEQLCCWAGITPRHYESDTTLRRGHVSKEGSAIVRWAAVESVNHPCEPIVLAVKEGIIARRGKTARNIAKVAAARKMLEVVYYTLRDGQARCLTNSGAAAA
jgi:transposase